MAPGPTHPTLIIDLLPPPQGPRWLSGDTQDMGDPTWRPFLETRVAQVTQGSPSPSTTLPSPLLPGQMDGWTRAGFCSQASLGNAPASGLCFPHL